MQAMEMYLSRCCMPVINLIDLLLCADYPKIDLVLCAGDQNT
jgi:hypothetical protein